jgi:hypothetical protein
VQVLIHLGCQQFRQDDGKRSGFEANFSVSAISSSGGQNQTASERLNFLARGISKGEIGGQVKNT